MFVFFFSKIMFVQTAADDWFGDRQLLTVAPSVAVWCSLVQWQNLVQCIWSSGVIWNELLIQSELPIVPGQSRQIACCICTTRLTYLGNKMHSNVWNTNFHFGNIKARGNVKNIILRKSKGGGKLQIPRLVSPRAASAHFPHLQFWPGHRYH